MMAGGCDGEEQLIRRPEPGTESEEDDLLKQNSIFALKNFKFNITGVFGRGGCAAVFKGRDENGRMAAIKVESVKSENKTVPKEFNMYKRLNDARVKHIMQLIDYGKTDSIFYMIMPVLGENLQQLKDESMLDLYTTLRIFQQLLLVLEDLFHLGIVHCDIKPDNVLIGPPGSENRQNVILADFGLAIKKAKCTSNTGSFYGTVEFASINAHSNNKQSPNDDMFSSFLTIASLISPLPWSKLFDDKKVGKEKEMFVNIKEHRRKYMQSLPPQMEQIFIECTREDYNQIINFALVHHLINQMIDKALKEIGAPSGYAKFEFPVKFDAENPYRGEHYGSPDRQTLCYESIGPNNNYCIAVNGKRALLADTICTDLKFARFYTRNDKRGTFKYTIFVKNFHLAKPNLVPEVIHFDKIKVPMAGAQEKISEEFADLLKIEENCMKE